MKQTKPLLTSRKMMRKRRHYFLTLPLLIMALCTVTITQPGCKNDHTANPDQVAFDAADGFAGGRLYDHFSSELNLTDPAIKTHPNFYRCKSCHGWDLMGRDGHLISMAPGANYPVVSASNLRVYASTHSLKEIFKAIKNSGGRTSASPLDSSMPDYGRLMSDSRIWELVKFLKNTANNTADFYDQQTSGTYPKGTITFSNIGKNGDAARGKIFYDAQCKSCHGADGSTLNIYCQGDWLGNVFRDDPFELQHKSKFGMPMDIDHPGCSAAGLMTTIPSITVQNINDLLKMGQDTTLFPAFH